MRAPRPDKDDIVHLDQTSSDPSTVEEPAAPKRRTGVEEHYFTMPKQELIEAIQLMRRQHSSGKHPKAAEAMARQRGIEVPEEKVAPLYRPMGGQSKEKEGERE